MLNVKAILIAAAYWLLLFGSFAAAVANPNGSAAGWIFGVLSILGSLCVYRILALKD